MQNLIVACVRDSNSLTFDMNPFNFETKELTIQNAVRERETFCSGDYTLRIIQLFVDRKLGGDFSGPHARYKRDKG